MIKGETKEHRATTPESANNFPTSATLLIFSSLSSGANPRFLFNPVLMLSPSNPYAGIPLETKYSSTAKEIVVFPAPERPNQESEIVFFFVKSNH